MKAGSLVLYLREAYLRMAKRLDICAESFSLDIE